MGNQGQQHVSGGHQPSDPASGGGVELSDPDGNLSVSERSWLVEKTLACLKVLECHGEVRIGVVADAAMAEAHLRYSGIPGTTDVLTFDLSGASATRDGALDTDILVCFDEARRQGAERGHTPIRELLLYVIHGVLHCLGHDDHDEAAHERMHAEEDRLLEAIGVGTTYATAAVAARSSAGGAP